MGHQLVALLCGSVKRYGIINLVVCGVRHLLVTAIDRGGRGIDKMLDLMVTASLKNIVETDKVALDISIRIGDAVAASCLCGEVHNYGNLVSREDFLYSILVCNGGVNKSPIPMLGFDFFQTLILDVDIIVIGERIYSNYLDVLDIVEDSLDEIATDKACSACHEDGFAIEIYIILYHVFCLCL